MAKTGQVKRPEIVRGRRLEILPVPVEVLQEADKVGRGGHCAGADGLLL